MKSTQYPVAANLQHLAIIKTMEQVKLSLDLIVQERTTNRRRKENYGILPDQITESMHIFIDEFMMFMTDKAPYPGRQHDPLKVATAMPRIEHLYRMWGWRLTYDSEPIDNPELPSFIEFVPIKSAIRNAKDYPEVLDIKAAADRAAEKTLQRVCRFIRWLQREREISANTERNVYEALIMEAKYLYRRETDYLNVRNYQDIPVIQVLRQERLKVRQRIQESSRVIDESRKWLDWPEFLDFVHRLEQECRGTYAHNASRSDSAIATSYQRYLMAGFLAYMPPDRQRTLRELEVGKTLVKGILSDSGSFENSDNGQWFIHLMPEDYKTGKSYKEQWHLVPHVLYPHLEDWLGHWRSVFSPHHNRVFTQKNGKEFSTPASFLSVLKRAALRLTGQALTPHLVRHMLITHLKTQGASDEVMRSLASAMHHSEEMQRKIYDRRSAKIRTQPAREVMMDLAAGKSLARPYKGRPVTVEELYQDFHLLDKVERQRLRKLIIGE